MRISTKVAFPISVICALLLATPAMTSLPAQAVKKVKPVDDTHPQRELSQNRQRPLSLLATLFEAVNSLKPETTRVHLQCRLADTLWEYDEPRARRWFKNALSVIDSVPEDDAVGPCCRPQLRAEVLGWVVARDPAWARRLALGFINEPGGHNMDHHFTEILTRTEPLLTVETMKRRIDDNDFTRLETFLKELQASDPASADDLFNCALTVTEQRQTKTDKGILYLFDYVFPNSAGSDTPSPDPTLATASPVAPALVKRFLEIKYNAMMQKADEGEKQAKENGSIGEKAGYGYVDVIITLPFFERYLPDKAASVRDRWDKMLLSLPGGESHIRETQIMFGPMSSQEAVSQAEQASDPLEKQGFYWRAMRIYTAEGKFDEALSAYGKIKDGIGRPEWELGIYVLAAKSAAARGDVDTAYRYAREIETLPEYTEAIGPILQLLAEKKEQGRATEIINEARKLIDKAKDNWQKPGPMLSVASAATRLSAAQGFEAVRRAIEVINRIKEFAQGVSDFDGNLLLLARADFERALSLARTLEDKERSLIAQVAVCRGALVGSPQ